MTGWAASELQFADLEDERRNKRLVRLVEDLAAQPNAVGVSINLSAGSAEGEKLP